MSGRVTVSGVQRKVALGLDGGTLRVAVANSRFLLKPQVREFPAMPENEHLTMCLARLVGINVAEVGLVRLNDDSLGLLVQRFDRTDDGQKVAMEDFCQLAKTPPSEKYEASAELCAKVIRRYSAAPPLDLLAHYRQLLFCWWIGNGDMHLKNLSLLDRGPGEPRLSPAYDLVNTNLAIPNDPFALSIDGKRNNIATDSWLRFAEYCELPIKMVRRVAQTFLAKESEAHAMVERSYLTEQLRDQYRTIMASRRAPIAGIAES